jgi:hypothetical protein
MPQVSSAKLFVFPRDNENELYDIYYYYYYYYYYGIFTYMYIHKMEITEMFNMEAG